MHNTPILEQPEDDDNAALRRRIAELERERETYLDMLRDRDVRDRRDDDE